MTRNARISPKSIRLTTLEIGPAHANEGWLLTVVVEDEAGPRLPDKGALAEGEEQISLHAFYNEFIRSGRGVANVFAEAEDKTAEARIERLVSSIEKNRHDPDRGRSGR